MVNWPGTAEQMLVDRANFKKSQCQSCQKSFCFDFFAEELSHTVNCVMYVILMYPAQ